MHIEIGIIDSARIAAANAAALGAVASQAPALARRPAGLVKAGLAAIVFSALMQAWHMPVGPSELHLIGATTVYLLFGFAPTVVGFALGLALQAALFEPQDMLHLGVNALSLIVPLVAVHMTFGRRLFAAKAADRFTFARVVRLDAVYYAGVSAMVGFWLMLSGSENALAGWATWVAAYGPVFLIEATLSFSAVMLVHRFRDRRFVADFMEVGRLRFA